MATTCEQCGKKINAFTMVLVSNKPYCSKCSRVVKKAVQEEQQERAEALRAIPKSDLEQVLCVTTQGVPGYEITEYKGVVHAQVILGVDAWKDFTSSFKSWSGGRVEALEAEMKDGFSIAYEELRREALLLGANAVLAAAFDGNLEVAGETGSNDKMMTVSASGTAVVVAKQ